MSGNKFLVFFMIKSALKVLLNFFSIFTYISHHNNFKLKLYMFYNSIFRFLLPCIMSVKRQYLPQILSDGSKC